MTKLSPSVPAIHRQQGGYDISGQPVLSGPMPIQVAIVEFNRNSVKTSVRADSSASRGRAEESTIVGTVLVLPNVKIDTGDLINVEGQNCEVASVIPRRNLQGVLCHYEIALRLVGDSI